MQFKGLIKEVICCAGLGLDTRVGSYEEIALLKRDASLLIMVAAESFTIECVPHFVVDFALASRAEEIRTSFHLATTNPSFMAFATIITNSELSYLKG